jgi:methylthioribose-1-phosphate isomerase
LQDSRIQSISWEDDHIRILDQTKLPSKETYLECRDVESVAEAIERLSIRGAPAIGVAAAMALAMGSQQITASGFGEFINHFKKMKDRLMKTRPTAVNLNWALQRMNDKALSGTCDDLEELKGILKREAIKICNEDIEINRAIGMQGQSVVPENAVIITTCNTGSLATAGFGTALGVIRYACETGKKIFVVACETRPLLQGARLTAWELKKDKIPFVLIADSMAGYYMKKKGCDMVITGADRIAANGDTANKIGTYTLSVLAKEHSIPFYIAAPLSTVDMSARTGEDIPIEERKSEEITNIAGKRMAPESVDVWNPAFDVAPHDTITGIITEKGIIRSQFDSNIKKVFEKKGENSNGKI